MATGSPDDRVSPVPRTASAEYTNHSNRVHKPSVSSSSANGSFNPRSCTTCRRRKVKCDKKQPCGNCTKAHIDCIFPAPGRAPRKPRKPQDAELMDRLRKLEGVVQSLGMQVEEDMMGSGVSRLRPHQQGLQSRKSSEAEMQDELSTREEAESCFKAEASGADMEDNSARFGRLVVEEGRSRYINNSYWASLNNEVEDLKAMLHESSDEEEEDYPSPSTSHSGTSHHGFMFGFSSTNVDMVPLHPAAERIPVYWQIYKENIDPIVKILHIPSIEPKILDASNHMSAGFEALLFSIYYGVVTTLNHEECLIQLGEEKDLLIKRYRFAFEQSLARAHFLTTNDITVLSAFVIFLILLRRNDDTKLIWALSGVVIRIAQTLGLHRDGTHFNLKPFDIEMRRRLWYQICLVDVRASEDHGCDPTIFEASFDTKMPLNVNDSDLSPDMKELPAERLGCTEMTFGLIRFEVASVLRRIQYTPLGLKAKCSGTYAMESLQQKEKWIQQYHQRLEEKYLRHADMSVPLYWVMATVARLVASKMWLMLYHPFQRLDGGASLPQDIRDKLFITSLENVEYALLLYTEARTMRWSWLFRTYVQWHAIAFLLSELCVRTRGPHVERAWRAVEATAAARWEDSHDQKQSALWKPLRKLMARAQEARQKALDEDGDLELQEIAPTQPLQLRSPQPSMAASGRSTSATQDTFDITQISYPTFSPGRETPLGNSLMTPFRPVSFGMPTGLTPHPITTMASAASPPSLFDPVPGLSAEIIPQQFNLDASFDWNALSDQLDENWDDAVRQFGNELPMDVDGTDLGLGPTIGGSHYWY
ncbi:hypothetical protein H2201_006242 [Coniosporium apollinis]|uniref:Zn(2)-C6 fungal-type domain-containing protein n=2 Tax=Coniosporium TaxID=2810619 RepID=A0ABQ9NPB0_9PEZI|nr:hypothetical protein H2199_007938 [Cladosporium sp. JES 115]KAJ9662134.1 hypothetical protein H2201_006242 [Coniosporium apollinis]